MIERVWHGITTSENSDRYITHLQDDTFPKLKKLSGHLNSKILKRQLTNNNIEFVIITRWKSMAEIRGFAGKISQSRAGVQASQCRSSGRHEESGRGQPVYVRRGLGGGKRAGSKTKGNEARQTSQGTETVRRCPEGEGTVAKARGRDIFFGGVWVSE